MCKLKSGIVLKNKIFMPDYDSHSDMLKELGIDDNFIGATKKFVRVELSPENGDPFSDIDGWILKVDQDIRPEWWSEEEYKPQIIEKVKEWAKTHIFVGVDGLKLNTGTNYYIKDCKDVEVWESSSVEAWGSSSVVARGSSSVEAWGSSSVEACDTATVKAYGSASVEAYGSASVEAYGSASVEACGSATVKACDTATVEAYGSASVEACGSASVKAYGSASVEACGSAVVFNSLYIPWENQSSLILSENATFKDNIGKVIYQSGDFKLVSVESGKTISECKVP